MLFARFSEKLEGGMVGVGIGEIFDGVNKIVRMKDGERGGIRFMVLIRSEKQSVERAFSCN